jgi:hypothetical protein
MYNVSTVPEEKGSDVVRVNKYKENGKSPNVFQ